MIVTNMKNCVAVSLMFFLGCSSQSIAMDSNSIVTDLGIDKTTMVSQNFRSRGDQKVQALLFHCVGYSNEWVSHNYVIPKDNGGMDASAHFYISNEDNETSKKGKIFQLVDPQNSAFHSGPSEWGSLAQANGLKGLNNLSIGIEYQAPGYGLINGEPYYPYSFAPFSEEQILAGITLSKQIMKEHKIPRKNVLWHSDVSPVVKTDPGPLFPVRRFAQHGIGVWPSSERVEDSQLDTSLKFVQTQLKEIGFPHVEPTGEFDEKTKHVLTRYYMHYLPGEVNWENHKTQTSGSVFDTIAKWEDFSFDKERLSISVENLYKKHYEFNSKD